MSEQKLSRTLHLHKDIEQDTVSKIIEDIMKINEEDDEKEKTIVDYKRQPIKLILNSFGGTMFCGFALCGVMESSRTPIHVYVYGYAMSMGLLIARFGHKTFAHRLATFMYHGNYGGVWGRVEEIRQTLEVYDDNMKMYDDELLKRTKIEKEKLDEVKQARKEWFIKTDEALKLGIIDEII